MSVEEELDREIRWRAKAEQLRAVGRMIVFDADHIANDQGDHGGWLDHVEAVLEAGLTALSDLRGFDAAPR